MYERHSTGFFQALQDEYSTESFRPSPQKNPDFSGIIVEVALTRDFNAPAKISIIGASCDKTARLGSVKRIGDVWITREASAKDDISKDSDVLRFTAAKFGLNWGMAPFLSSAKKEVELPALERL